MALPTTGTGSAVSGYLAQGVTTIYWGTNNMFGSYVVTKMSQKTLVDNQKLPNGDGLTSTRVQIIDGMQWDLTVRDDSGMTPPSVGTTVTVYDAGGIVPGGTRGASYTTRVVESGWDSAPKTAAERSITVEALTLIEL